MVRVRGSRDRKAPKSGIENLQSAVVAEVQYLIGNLLGLVFMPVRAISWFVFTGLLNTDF